MSDVATLSAWRLRARAMIRSVPGRGPVQPWQLVLVTTLFVVATGNLTFFRQLLAVYPASGENMAFIMSVAGLLYCLLAFLLLPLAHPRTVKPWLVLVLMTTASVGYFQDTFGTIIDPVMIRSVVETDQREAWDLLNLDLVWRVVLFGVLPGILIATRVVANLTTGQALVAAGKMMVIALVTLVALLLAFGASYASFFREHKMVRFYTNPIAPVVFLVDFLVHDTSPTPTVISTIATDAQQVIEPGTRPRLMILVVGEAVRAQNLGINGYERDTTPHLAQAEIINFTQVQSCGTATAVSVPCMFSALSREDFSVSEARQQENVLDVLQRAGVQVLWRDNNSDSKGVALRVPFEDFRSPEQNPLCNPECRDEGMLAGLQAWVDSLAGRSGMVVLHQMGNHGPAYYKRYPPAFEHYVPTCQSSELASCSQQEVINAYDNSLRYTDYFLSRVIGFLAQNSNRHDTLMLYVSDHGESLGEFGVYLHGLPYSLAPAEQIQVPLIMWFGGRDTSALMQKAGDPFSHDNLFHTLLDYFDVETSARDESLSLLRG